MNGHEGAADFEDTLLNEYRLTKPPKPPPIFFDFNPEDSESHLWS